MSNQLRLHFILLFNVHKIKYVREKRDLSGKEEIALHKEKPHGKF